MTQAATKDGWKIVFPLMLGIAAFLLFAGPQVLIPDNIAWLTRGDAPQHYLGWAFFRESDWTFPIGLNPSYGLELSSTIVYSDSIPLLAILFKMIDPLLPETFQYFGLWLLLCFVAQAVLAWKLIGLFSQDAAARILGAGFLVSAPPMVNRMTVHINSVAHLTLVGHFLILAALYLFLRPSGPRGMAMWFLLLGTAVAVHAYFFAMVGAFWLADLIRSVSRKERSGQTALGILGAAMVMIVTLAWQIGYFGVGTDFIAGGYGYFNLNLLSLINASGWSYVMPDIPNHGGTYEGFNYLGLGVLVLAAAAYHQRNRSGVDIRGYLHKERALVVTGLALTAFAISNTISIGPVGFGLPFPEPLSTIANVFRSSGRMFWPVYYLLLLGIIFMILHGFRRKSALAILAGTLVIQIADTSAAWITIRTYFSVPPAAHWQTRLVDPFWNMAARRYETLRLVPPRNKWNAWSEFAAYAQSNGMATDVVYVARYDDRRFDPHKARSKERLSNGQYDLATLYLVQPEDLETARANLNQDIDMIAHIDGVTVIAPGWMTCDDCLAIFDPPSR